MFLNRGKNLAAKLSNFDANYFNGLHSVYKTAVPVCTAG
jgi:hypothetical protein